MKKILLVVLSVLLLVGVVNAQNWTNYNRWLTHDGKKICDIYYDSQVFNTESGTTILRVKLMYTDWGQEVRRRENSDNKTMLDIWGKCLYSVMTIEFNFKASQYRPLRTQYFTYNSELINELTVPGEWKEVQKGTLFEEFMKIARGF